MFYDLTYMWNLNKTNTHTNKLKETENRWVVARNGNGGRTE